MYFGMTCGSWCFSYNFAFFKLPLRYGYQLVGKGKWTSMSLKKPKEKGTKKVDKKKQKQQKWAQDEDNEDQNEGDEDIDSVFHFLLKCSWTVAYP